MTSRGVASVIFAAIAASPVGAPPLSASPSSAPDAFVRDQPRVRSLVGWDGRVVARIGDGGGRGSAFSWIDASPPKATPVFAPGDRALVAVASAPGGDALALCREAPDRFVLFRGRPGGNWNMEVLPRDVTDAQGEPVLVTDARRVVIAANGRIVRNEGSGWTRVAVKAGSERDPFTDVLAGDDYALVGDEPYIAYAHGEWGGELARVNVVTGARASPLRGSANDDGLPVTDLAVDGKGRLWATEGLSHMGLVAGAVRVLEGGAWRTVSAVGGFPDKPALNWSLPPASIDAIAFDGADRPCVLTGELGVLRYDAGRWKRLTPTWPGYVYASSLHVLDDKTLLIGLYDAGVLVWHLDSGAHERIALAESFDRF